jgi:hypothetical protein
MLEYNPVNKTNFVHNFSCMSISILYVFWATMCPSSRKITLSMQHLVLVTLCGRLSGMQDGMIVLVSQEATCLTDVVQQAYQQLMRVMLLIPFEDGIHFPAQYITVSVCHI